MSVREYVIIVEKAGRNYGAYAPDLPGCVAVGDTRRETIAKMRSAIEFHLEGLRDGGWPIPRPTSLAKSIKVNTPPVKRTAVKHPLSATNATARRNTRHANGRTKRV